MFKKMSLMVADEFNDIRAFITEFSQSFSINSVHYCEIWRGDRGYWFAYMLQLAFDSGTIMQDKNTNDYYWMSHSGDVYGPTGMVKGLTLKSVKGIPAGCQFSDPKTFVDAFFSQQGREIPLMRRLFGQQYAWHFAHMICRAVGYGEVCFKIDTCGEPRPIWWDGTVTCCGVCGVESISSEQCIEEDEFMLCMAYFRNMSSANVSLRSEVRRVVDKHLSERQAKGQPTERSAVIKGGASSFIEELNQVKLFISEFRQASRLSNAAYREVWSGDRGYWFAYMLQLTFNSGTIVQAMDTKDYLWMDHNGNIFSPTGMVRGLALRKVKGIPSSYTCDNPGTFVDAFFKEYLEEVPNMREMFDQRYAWHFANMIHRATGFGRVCFKVVGNGEPYPVCCDHTGFCYSAQGLSSVSPDQCIEESEFALCLDYFRRIPSASVDLHKEVMNVVARRARDTSTGQSVGKEEVLAFISHFTGTDGEQVGVFRRTFAVDYSYYFALMLCNAFQRGSVQMLYPYTRFVWVDIDGTAYDIAGVADVSGASLIPWESLESVHHTLLHPELR